MFRPVTLASGQASSPFPQYKFDKWSHKGVVATALLLRITYPITVTVGTWTAAAFATLIVAILNAAIGSLTLSYGGNQQFKPWVGVQGSEVRNAHRFCMRRDCPNTLPTANVTTGTYNWTVDLYIPFHVPALINGRSRLPGFSQIKTMQLDIIEGAAYSNTATGTAARTSGVNVTIDVDVLTQKGADQWSPLLSYYKANTTDFECIGPDGTHLAAWDDNAGFGSTAISLFSLYFDGGDPHTDQMPPYAVDDRYLDDWIEGGAAFTQSAAIDDNETLFFAAENGQDLNDLPHGKISVKLPTMYVATIKLRGLYWPILSQTEAEEATRTAATMNQSGVLLSASDDSVYYSPKAVRSMPAKIYTDGDPLFTTKPGYIVTQPGRDPFVTIPAHVKDQVMSMTKQAAPSGAQTVDAARSQALTQVAKAVPGFAAVAASVANAGASAQSGVITGEFQRKGVAV